MSVQGDDKLGRSGDEMRQFCSRGKISVDALREKISSTPQDAIDQMPLLHWFLMNENVTPEIVEYLLNGELAVNQRDDEGRLPIHLLCRQWWIDNAVALQILEQLIEACPSSVREENNNGYLPVHIAVMSGLSHAFCKLLVDADPGSLKIKYRGDLLPLHFACKCGDLDTVKYLLEKYPESVNIRDRNYGNIPLHWACSNRNLSLPVVQFLFDMHPEAILFRNNAGRTPLDCARLFREGREVVQFLEAQMVYARTARDMTAMTTPDTNGCLPLHQALRGNASLGAIKLLANANPAALEVADLADTFPLQIACEYSSADVVKYLLELDDTSLNHFDTSGNSLLHYACLGGNCGIITLLLERNDPSVSERNADNKLPIHLLCETADGLVDRNSPEYVEAIYSLLRAHPVHVLNN